MNAIWGCSVGLGVWLAGGSSQAAWIVCFVVFLILNAINPNDHNG